MYCLICGQLNKLSAEKCSSCQSNLKNLDEIILPKCARPSFSSALIPAAQSSEDKISLLIAKCNFDEMEEEFLAEAARDPKGPKTPKVIEGADLLKSK